MESRRMLFRGFGVVAMAAATPSLFAGRRGKDIGEVEPHYSRAVANGMFGAFTPLLGNRTDTGQFRVALHSWRVTGEHFDEIGLFKRGEDLVRTTDINAVMAEVHRMPVEIVRIADEYGEKVDIEALQARIAALTPDRVTEALTYLASSGPAALFDRVSQTLEDLANDRRPGRSAGSRVTSASDGFCQGLAAIEATLWILAALYTIGCAATGGVCVPCCMAAGVLGLAAGAVALLEVIVC